jgi:hypothetical protein
MRHLAPWAVRSALISAAFALAACSGPGSSSVPGAVGAQTLGAPQAAGQSQLNALGVQPDTTCPKQYYNCYTFSLSKGLAIDWCYGPSSNPCSETGKYKWTGGVCASSNKLCYPPHPFLKSFVVKWTGPFKCKTTCTGTYELDKLTKGSPAPKKTTKYAFKQDIHACPKAGGKCIDAHIGLSVGS